MDKKTLITGGVIAIICLLVGIGVGSSFSKGLLGGTTVATWTAANLVSNGTLNITGISTLTAGITAPGANNLTGVNRFKSFVTTGATSLVAGATTSISAAKACDEGVVGHNPTTVAVGTTTLPVAELVFADCLTTDGDRTTFIFRNASAATSTIIAVGSASTTLVGTTGGNSTIGAAGMAIITLVRAASNLMYAYIEEGVAIVP